jgi:hypothetical protein
LSSREGAGRPLTRAGAFLVLSDGDRIAVYSADGLRTAPKVHGGRAAEYGDRRRTDVKAADLGCDIRSHAHVDVLENRDVTDYHVDEAVVRLRGRGAGKPGDKQYAREKRCDEPVARTTARQRACDRAVAPCGGERKLLARSARRQT